MASSLRPLDDFKTADLPDKTTSNWRLAGPGAILVGLSIGAGEIIIWPRIVAEFGAAMVWAAVLGVFIQMWINLEIGRWTIATGETVYTGYCRVWRGFAHVFILLTLLGWLAPAWGRVSGLALKALLVGPEGWGSDTFWTVVTFAGVALVLFGPKIAYKGVERTVEILIVLITAGLIMVAVAIGSAQTWGDLGRGVVNFGRFEPAGKRRIDVVDVTVVAAEFDTGVLSEGTVETLATGLELSDSDLDAGVTVTTESPGSEWTIRAGDRQYPVRLSDGALLAVTPALTAKAFFIALVFAGAGGTANLFYSFYLRDKHVGMGARIPSMQNPLRGKVEKIPSTGFRYEDSESNRSRFKAWWSFVVQDQVIYFWILNSVTMMLFIFGSLAVLHPRGIVPGKGTLIWDQAEVLASVWGPTGRTVFLIVGLATLFSTQLALVDGVSRSMADIVRTNFAAARHRDVSWWYIVVAVVWILAGCLITLVMEQLDVSDLGFLFNAAYMGGFAMAIYVPLTLYINHRYLPGSARPGIICTLMMIVASCVYVGFALFCAYSEISRLLGF